MLFAWLLTRIEADFADCACAACGGVCIPASLAYRSARQGPRPGRWDLGGATLALSGAAMILFGPRGT